jgi:hypothetical protein
LGDSTDGHQVHWLAGVATHNDLYSQGQGNTTQVSRYSFASMTILAYLCRQALIRYCVFKVQHNIHILHRSAGSALTKVIVHGDQNGLIMLIVMKNIDIHVVGIV